MPIDNLIQTNPIYTANLTFWPFLRDSYEGTGGYRSGEYIEKYAKEATAKHTSRKSISHYYNFCAPIIDTYIGHLFKMAPTRQSSINELNTFWTDTARGGGININELMREASTLAHVYGHCFVVVDMPNEEADTLLDQQEKDIRPYAYTVTPESVLDWALDSNGSLLWIKIKEVYDINEDDPLADHTLTYRYRIWDKTGWWLYGKLSLEAADDELLASGAHDLGVVPVAIVYNKKGIMSPLPGISEISDIAKINKRLFNLLSELDELLRGQAFSIVTYQTDNPENLSNVELGTDRILTYPLDTNKPEYISPPSTAMDSYEKRIESTIQEIYRLAKLNYTGGVSPSGLALKFEFEKTNQALSDKAENLSDAEYRIADIVCRWTGKVTDASITYSRDFNLNDMERELDVVLNAVTLDLGQTFKREYMKYTYRNLMPQLANETKKVIDNEIDTAETLPDVEDEIIGE